ncbi:hypothetical protein F5H01DRAFT_72971 [Linnemannia elongata]|nr:hypothetical protein F5H01DRAFT_72971 [Linnemannia elongata]
MSVHLPSQLTVHSVPSSLSTDLSGATPSIYRHHPQHPGSKRRRQKKAAASAAAATSTGTGGPINNIKAKNTTPSRRDKGKQRAKSRSRAGSLLDVDDSRGRYPSTQRHRRQHHHQQNLSTLSLSTIHTWCPYCCKTVPSQDQSDHHHRHHLHNLISPTRTPLRIESDSSSCSSSRSSRSHRSRSLSPYPHPATSSQQQRQQRQRQRSASVDTVRSSILSLSSKKSYLSSDIEAVIPPATQVIPNTLFTFVHPLPHQQVQTKAAATTTSGTAPLPALAALTPTTTSTTGAHPTPLPFHPHPELVVSASTPTVSSASSSPASSPSSPSSAAVVRRSNSARAPQRPHRPQESKLEVSGNRFLFVGTLDTPAEKALSTLSPAAAASTIAASFPPPSSSPPSSLVVNLPVKETPLPPLPFKQPPTTTKRRPLSWAFPSPSSLTFTHPFKNKQKDQHSSTSRPQQRTTTTTNFPTGSQQQQQQSAFVSGSAPLSTSTPCPPPPLFIQFVRGLETHPWFSDPSTTDRDVNIRDIYPQFGSGGGGASGGITGGGGNSHHHPKGASFDDPALFASGSAKRRSWTTLFPFRSRRSSMPAATLSATSAPSAGATIIPTSPSTSAVHQHPNYHNHHRYQSQQLYPLPQQQDQHQKKRSTFKRFSAPTPTRKMEVLTIQQQEALLPTMPSTAGGHYPSALEGAGHQQVIGSTGRGRDRVIYDPNKPLPAIVAEGESDEDDGHSSNRPASNEPALHSSQGQSRLPPVPPATVLPTLSLPAAPTPSSSSSTQPPSSPTASLPVVAEGWSQQQQQQPAVMVKKHQRRMSFLPSSLMTSNLAKFISGNGSNNNSNNNNNSQTATFPTTGSSTGRPTLTLSSNAFATTRGGTNPVSGRQGYGQGGMGGRDGVGGTSTTLNPTSLWSSSRSPGPGEGESFQVDGILHQGRSPFNNTTTNATSTAAAAGATNTALTIEQFKWTMICCCNEIKTRVFKQQQQQRQGSLQVDAPHAPPSLGRKSYLDSHNPYSAAALPPTASSNKKADKNKSRSSNGNGGNSGGSNSGSGSGHLSSANNSYNTTAAIEQAAQESRKTLQALLMVMTSSSSSMGIGMDKDRDGLDPTVLASNVQAYRGSNATPVSQLQNQSLLSLIGSSGGASLSATGAAPPTRSHSSHHLSRYSSHSVLLTGPTTTPGGQPSASGAPTTPLRNNKSQPGLANSYAQATNTILNPLSLQDLALLLAYLLSIAPEQWIPWHLYDFFVRPQGRSYKDLIEMLPTHSQRILKALLETVEALIDYATVTGLQYQRALSQQQQQQNGPAGKQPTLAHLRSRSEVDPGHSRNNGGYGVGANPMLKSAGSSTLSLARALAILEPPFSAQEQQQLQQQQQMKQQQADLHPGARGGDTVHQEIALRGRKRRVILDSLSGLVFRPRANESHRGDGGAGSAVGGMGVLIESPTESGGGGLLSPEEKGNGGKGKAMRRRSFLGAAASITSSGSSAAAAGALSPAAVALQLQMSEREREAGHSAFENLVSAFEIEYVRPLPSVVAGFGTDAKASTTTVGLVEAGAESQDELSNVSLPQSLAAAGSVARIRSSAGGAVLPGQGIDRSFTLPSTLHQQQPPPRQARSLPTAVSTPTDLAAVRSLSLPPWRKKHHSALQLGQHPPPSPVSPSVASSARQEWLPQYAFQSQSSSQQLQQLPPLPPQSPATVATAMGAEPAPVPLNRVLTVSTNSIADSPSEELTETSQQQPPVVESAPVSASGSTTTLPAVVQSLAIAGVPVSVGAFGPRSGSVVASEMAPGALDAEEETVEVRLRGGVVSPTTGVIPAPATLPRRTSRRSSTRKTRPMSLDNGRDSASLSSSKLLRTRTLSGTISSSWTEWKDHLLVLEEEEYVIEDSSESLSISSVSSDSEGSCSSDSEDGRSEDERGGGGHDNEHEYVHEHDDHADDRSRQRKEKRKEKRQERRRREDGQESGTPAASGGGEDGRRTNKSSGTFGDLRALAAAIAASQKRQQQQTQQHRAGGSGAGGVV